MSDEGENAMQQADGPKVEANSPLGVKAAARHQDGVGDRLAGCLTWASAKLHLSTAQDKGSYNDERTGAWRCEKRP